MGYRRSQQEHKRLQRLYDKTKHGCCRGAYYHDGKQRYVRYSCGSRSGETSYYKRATNRRVRRTQHVKDHGGYRRELNMWDLLV